MEWIKKNKLAVVLIAIILFLLFKNYFFSFLGARSLSKQRVDYAPGVSEVMMAPLESAGGLSGLSRIIPPVPQQEAPPSESKERLVVEESSMSLVVDNVRQSVDKIVDYAKEAGGFMVSSSLTSPEEAPYAAVVIRVPSDKLRETLDHFRNLAIKVSSENIRGTDVTSEYEDIGAKLVSYEKVKTKFEEILERATKVQDILTVQRELINVQRQIDNLKGKQKYLEQTAKLAKITAYLSTDEWALPYAPTKPFRAKVIFKQAVRSLVLTLRGLGKSAIWLGVYSVIWLPALVLIIFWKKRKKQKAQKPGSTPAQ